MYKHDLRCTSCGAQYEHFSRWSTTSRKECDGCKSIEHLAKMKLCYHARKQRRKSHEHNV